MRKVLRQLVTILLVVAMVFSVNGEAMIVTAATAPMKLSTTSITVAVGDSETVTLDHAPKGAKSTWSSMDSKIATVKDGKITGIKAGSTKVEGKVTYTQRKKKITKKFTVSVTVKKEDITTVTPVPTAIPEESNLGAEHKSMNGITTKDNGLMRKDLSSQYLIMNYMGQGWNLGNTMDATRNVKSTKVVDYETAWSYPVTTQKCIDGLQKYGINTVRIPISWSNMISDDGKYTINPDFMNRVEEIINYCLNDGMYAVINIHYDRGWWSQFGAKDKAWRDKAMARYESFWTQIANRYKEYSDRLIFESGNEELGDRFNDEIDESTGYAKSTNRTGTLTEDECYKLVNTLNQKFIDIVRNSGGNNTYRHLLIAGYNTDIDKTVDSKSGRFVMPKDSANTANKLSVSIHYYAPSTYGIAQSVDNSWGYKDSWGTADDIKEMKTNFEKMKKFSDDGYGVMIGEYGVCSVTKKGIPDYYYQLMKINKELGYLPIMWDTGLYDRETGLFKYKDVLAKMLEITGSKAQIPADAIVTGKEPLVLIDESKLTKVYSWEGLWAKNDGSCIGLEGKKVTVEDVNKFVSTTSKTDEMDIVFNVWGYQSFTAADWSKFTKPCVRAYFKVNTNNAVGTLQLAYCDRPNGPWNSTVEYEFSEGWSGKCVQLNLDQLKKHPYLMVAFGKAPTVTKIEIFDASK